jgi:fructosamine-3-kinase
MNDTALISEILDQKVTKVNPILHAGHVNRVYLVECSQEKFVVRLNNQRELARFEKEVWCIEEGRKVGVPGPQVIGHGLQSDSAYMVLNYLDGLNSTDIHDDLEKVWNTVGMYTQRIHTIQVDGFGEDMIEPGRFVDTWERYLHYNIESLNKHDYLLEHEFITYEQSGLLKSEFSRLLDTKFHFGLLHGDLSLDNIIISDQIYLFDWGVAQASIIPHLEFVNLIENNLNPKSRLFEYFLRGYALSKEDYIKMEKDIRTLGLLQAVDKLRFAIDRKPEKIAQMVEKVQLYLEK